MIIGAVKERVAGGLGSPSLRKATQEVRFSHRGPGCHTGVLEESLYLLFNDAWSLHLIRENVNGTEPCKDLSPDGNFVRNLSDW